MWVRGVDDNDGLIFMFVVAVFFVRRDRKKERKAGFFQWVFETFPTCLSIIFAYASCLQTTNKKSRKDSKNSMNHCFDFIIVLVVSCSVFLKAHFYDDDRRHKLLSVKTYVMKKYRIYRIYYVHLNNLNYYLFFKSFNIFQNPSQQQKNSRKTRTTFNIFLVKILLCILSFTVFHFLTVF